MPLQSANSIVAYLREAWRPPPRLLLSDWARRYAYLSSESSAEAGRWQVIPYQTGIMDAFVDPAVEQITVMKSARVGYALALDTPIPTALGWSTMGELKRGAVVLDDQGKQCAVTYASPVFTDHDCYEIEFCDGTKITADAGHRWLVESDVSFEHLNGSRGEGRTGRPKPGQVATKAGVIDTATMAAMLHTSRGRNALAISVCAPLDLPERELPVPPYTLGLWLGDGHMVGPRITQHRSDVETAQYIQAEGIAVSVQYADHRYPNNASYFLDCEGGRRDPSPWAKVMRAMGVLSNKHIPVAYLRASVAQRTQLLRGLMDSDGNLTGGRRAFAEFVNTNKRLAEGAYELVCSLGMKASMSIRAPKQAQHLMQYRVVFRPSPRVNPFNLTRKANRIQPLAKPTITNRRRVVAVRPVESVPVRCIEVGSASHLFLCSRAMIPTHNTKCINNAIAYHIHQDPCPMMVVQPTVEDAEGYSKEEIAPMFRDTPALRGIVVASKTKDSSNTILQKQFPGGTLSFVGANSGRGFRRVSRRIVFFDEVDGYPASIGAEGDPIQLGIRRTEYYWNRKIVAGSTPTIKGLSKIESLFEQSDQRRYFVPCPHCGEYQVLKFGGREHPYGLKWPEGKPIEAYYVCEITGCRIEHSAKREMVSHGEWRATAIGAPRHAGFHIWAAYSYSPNATWGHIATEFLASVRDTEALKTFVNTVLGETWEEKSDAFDSSNLKSRLEQYPAEVPYGVGLLVGSVDVQGDRLEWKCKGYGDREESWLIATSQVYGDPAKEQVWLELDKDLTRTFTHESGRQMAMRCVAVDSGGLHTDHVYKFCKVREERKVCGQSQHVYAIKGVGGAGREMVSKPTRNNRYKTQLWPLGVDTIKDTVFARLHIIDKGPGYMHMPSLTDDEYLEQLTAEKAVRRYKKGVGTVREYIKIRERNEALDLEVYCLAALNMLGRATVQRLRTYAEEMSALIGAPPVPAPVEQTPPSLQIKTLAPKLPSQFAGYGKGWVNSWKK